MGDRLTESEESSQTALRSYGDIFDEAFPHYLAMGMSPEEYWDGESGLKKAYRKAFAIRIENEQLLADRQNWYMGQYLIKALQAVPLLVGGLNVKPGMQLPDYPDKPFLQKAAEMKKKEVRRKQEEDQAKLAMAMMQAAFKKFNKRFEQKQAESQKAVNAGK